MNGYILTAAILALMTTLGHFAVGSKQFLLPMLRADFDRVAQKVMHSVFHYVSVFLILSTLALFVVALGNIAPAQGRLLTFFIALHYLLFALWQIGIALTSDLKKPLFKLFQWVFFVLIAFFGVLGIVIAN